MVKLYEGGAYLLHGTEVIADAPDALAAVKSKTGIETTKEAAAKETMAYGILSAHNTSGNMQQLQIKFDKLTSHDITFVGIIQTARASGLEKFPIPYVLTNCHNSLCAVGGTINEDYLETAPDEYYESAAVSEENSAEENTDTVNENNETQEKVVNTIVVSSPITGMAGDITTCPDEGFAGKMMGDGAVVTPEDAVICAPEDGEVLFVFETKHALGFQTESGLGMLLHIGIDTVSLNGEGFEVFVENGQKVKKGDPLMKIDIPFLTSHAPSLCSPVLCTELEENQRVRLLATGEVKAGDPLFAVDTVE